MTGVGAAAGRSCREVGSGQDARTHGGAVERTTLAAARAAEGGERGASGALWGSCGVVWIVHGESAGGGGRRRSVWAQRPGQTGGRRTVAQTSGTAAVLYWHLPFSFLSLLKHCAMVHNTSRHATALRCTHLH